MLFFLFFGWIKKKKIQQSVPTAPIKCIVYCNGGDAALEKPCRDFSKISCSAPSGAVLSVLRLSLLSFSQLINVSFYFIFNHPDYD